ncbi:MAG: hypothetical protein LUE24_07420 [Lachnospiraceae bacterium]|nr:hypothetical protein [Lachnospiraceae bacterium]
MAPMAMTVNEMLDTLEEEDYKAAVRYIQFLSTNRKQEKAQESKDALREMQRLFGDDKGWNSEEEMLEDMAAFRRDRQML